MAFDLTNLLPLFVAGPMGVAFIVSLVARLRRDRVLDVIAVVSALGLFTLAVMLVISGGAASLLWVGGWGNLSARGLLGIALHCDGLTRLVLAVVNLVAFFVAIFATDYIKRYTSPGLFYSLFFLMIAGMNGVVLAGDLFNLYVFLELASLCSYSLVAFGTRARQFEAAFKYLVLGSLSTLLVLTGIVLLYSFTGTLNLAQMTRELSAASAAHGGKLPAAAFLALGFFLAGFGLKSAMVPFHAWLPDAHPAAPAPVSAMLSGVLIKAVGAYAIIRIVFNVFGASPAVATILMVLGSLSMVVGVLCAFGQKDLKRLLAYSSISQMGYVILAFGIGCDVLARKGPQAVAELAVFGGLFHLVNHATFKSLLFLTAGSIEHATGTRNLDELGGLSGRMPVTSWCCRIASLSISGVPPFSGFWSKLIIIIAAIQAGHWGLGVLAVAVSLLTLALFVKVQRAALGGATTEKTADAHESSPAMAMPMAALAAVVVAVGLLGFLCPPFRHAVFDPARDVVVRGVSVLSDVEIGSPK